MVITANLILIVFTCLVSWQAIENPALSFKLSHYPYEVKRNNEYYRWITSGFVHANLGHLIFNMIALWFFGNRVESEFQNHFGEWTGRIIYLSFYITAIVLADITVYLKHRDNLSYLSLGASGAVAAVLFSSIVFDPWIGIYLMFIPIPIPGIVFGILYLFFEWWSGKNRMDNINHDAHFWGAIYGFIFTVVAIPDAYGDFVNKLIYHFQS
jgi:membrane associated rhomboid family serine protease